MKPTDLKPGRLPPLGPPYDLREKIILEYARDRLAAGFSIVVHHGSATAGSTDPMMELSKAVKDVPGSEYILTRWPRTAGSIDASKLTGGEFVESCPRDTARWILQVAIRHSIPIYTDPPITPDRKRETQVDTSLRETYSPGVPLADDAKTMDPIAGVPIAAADKDQESA